MSESSFTADWLALREGPDHAARDVNLAAQLGEWMARNGARNVLDLGCGSGSTLRALAPHMPDETIWTLIDHDAELLTIASARLTAWADEATEDSTSDGATSQVGPALRLSKGAKRILVRMQRRDLSANGLTELLQDCGAEVAAASAFFDLAGAAFIDAFATVAHRAGAAVHAALTYDGREIWTPGHPAEAEALAAFHTHTRRDKGLGPATGADAADVLQRALHAVGYDVYRASTPWRLKAADDAALIGELAKGAVAAVAEIVGDTPWLQDWSEARARATTVEIGHADLLALP